MRWSLDDTDNNANRHSADAKQKVPTLNSLERQMVTLLQLGREGSGIVSVKAEFEAEGTRTDEILRLSEIASRAGLPLTLKIGGCEAIMDMRLAKQLGVGFVVAPMVESDYALQKYIAAKNRLFTLDEETDTKFLFNVETITTFRNLDEMTSTAAHDRGVSGVVFGRVDFAGSLGLTRESIESDAVSQFVLTTASRCKEAGLDFVLGGGISVDSIPVIEQATELGLDRFETRKIVFSSTDVEQDLQHRLLLALDFELLWLENKRGYYSSISGEDLERIRLLTFRRELLVS